MARLIESPLWVDFTRKKSPASLKQFIQPLLLDPDACLCEPVAFEVLRHATDQERKWIKAQFATFPLLPTPAKLWREATGLGQQCRQNGFTAGSIDLVIAAIAIHHQAELLTFDAHYRSIAENTPLRVLLLKRPTSLNPS